MRQILSAIAAPVYSRGTLRCFDAARACSLRGPVNPPRKLAHSPWIAESPVSRCRTQCADVHHPRSCAHRNICSHGSSWANARWTPPKSSSENPKEHVVSTDRSPHPPPERADHRGAGQRLERRRAGGGGGGRSGGNTWS